MLLKKSIVGGAAVALIMSGFGAVTANAAAPNAPVINNYCTLSTQAPTSPASDAYYAYITFGQGDCPSYIFDYSTGVWGDVAQPAAPAGSVLTRAALGHYLVADSGYVLMAKRSTVAAWGTPVDNRDRSYFEYDKTASNFWPCGSLDCAGALYVDPYTTNTGSGNWNGGNRSTRPSGASIALRNWYGDVAGTYFPASTDSNNYAELYNETTAQTTRWTFAFAPFVIQADTSVAVTSAKKSNGKLAVKTRMNWGQGYYQCDVANKAAVGGANCVQGITYYKSYAELYRDGKLIKTVKMNPNTGIAKFNVKAKKRKSVYVVKSYFQSDNTDFYKTAVTTFTK